MRQCPGIGRLSEAGKKTGELPMQVNDAVALEDAMLALAMVGA